MYVLQRIDGWTQSFLPEIEVDDGRQPLRARVALWAVAGMTMVIVVGWVLRFLIAPLPWFTHAMVLGGLFLLALSLVSLRRGQLTRSACLTLLAFFLVIFGSAFRMGGLDAPVLLLTPALPLLATVMLNLRAGVWSGVFAAAMSLVFLGMAEQGKFFGTPLTANQEPRAQALLVIVSCSMAVLFCVFYEHHRRLLEQRSASSEALYRRLFELSKDPVVMSTPEGRLLDANPAALEFYGFDSKEAMLARPVQEIYQDVSQREELLRRLEKVGYVHGYESSQVLRDGQKRIVRGTTSALKNADGSMHSLLAQLHDVTEERRAEQQIRRMVVQLESKNQELERFAYTVSHDLKGPLFTLKGFLNLLAKDLRSGQPEKVERDLAALHRSADSLQRLVEDLLEYSRLGHGSGTWAEARLRTLVTEVSLLLSGQAEKRGVAVHIEPDLPVLFGQVTLLHMLIQNLLENAIKYASSRVTIGGHTDQDGEAHFFVRDDGPGIDPKYQGKIFNLFEKLDADSQGTGIGLASVQRIVELHQGRVWVESIPGEGATFYCRLPTRGRWKAAQEEAKALADEDFEVRRGPEPARMVPKSVEGSPESS